MISPDLPEYISDLANQEKFTNMHVFLGKSTNKCLLPRPDIWKELSTTFKIRPDLQPDPQPRTVAEAKARRWIKINGCEDKRFRINIAELNNSVQ